MQSRLVMESPASKQLKTHVLPPLSPPNFTHISVSGMIPSCQMKNHLVQIQVVLHAALPHQKQWRHQKPLTICTYRLKIPLG
ncbi:hypothetical protein EMCRGX_G027856 [Ephydatia muelleri]